MRLIKIALVTALIGVPIINVGGLEFAMYGFVRGYEMGCNDAFKYDYIIAGIRTKESAESMKPWCKHRAEAIWQYRHD